VNWLNFIKKNPQVYLAGFSPSGKAPNPFKKVDKLSYDSVFNDIDAKGILEYSIDDNLRVSFVRKLGELQQINK
jgi:hypothetical protein